MQQDGKMMILMEMVRVLQQAPFTEAVLKKYRGVERALEEYACCPSADSGRCPKFYELRERLYRRSLSQSVR